MSADDQQFLDIVSTAYPKRSANLTVLTPPAVVIDPERSQALLGRDRRRDRAPRRNHRRPRPRCALDTGLAARLDPPARQTAAAAAGLPGLAVRQGAGLGRQAQDPDGPGRPRDRRRGVSGLQEEQVCQEDETGAAGEEWGPPRGRRHCRIAESAADAVACPGF